jgi:HAD superfamily hydrolase (TIGR01509 family)
LVKGLQGLHRLAVGTNSERDVAAASLTATGLLGFFDHVVTISDGVPPKPAPDIFMRAAGLLKAEFSQTLVFEDSNEGVQAALTAGMDVVQLLPS